MARISRVRTVDDGGNKWKVKVSGDSVCVDRWINLIENGKVKIHKPLSKPFVITEKHTTTGSTCRVSFIPITPSPEHGPSSPLTLSPEHGPSSPLTLSPEHGPSSPHHGSGISETMQIQPHAQHSRLFDLTPGDTVCDIFYTSSGNVTVIVFPPERTQTIIQPGYWQQVPGSRSDGWEVRIIWNHGSSSPDEPATYTIEGDPSI